MAALIADLKDRGLLDSTLVIWMGDFGRTPKIGKQGGRDHYPRAWTTLLAGAGIKPGQVIGGTDAQGSTVVERPTSAIDFMATVCRALDIDHTKEFRTKDGRPIRVVDKGEKVVTELF
jgi:arylsulfatase A-like enzyme